jgi:energy-converting hydrogenase Eha subunit H
VSQLLVLVNLNAMVNIFQELSLINVLALIVVNALPQCVSQMDSVDQHVKTKDKRVAVSF